MIKKLVCWKCESNYEDTSKHKFGCVPIKEEELRIVLCPDCGKEMLIDYIPGLQEKK